MATSTQLVDLLMSQDGDAYIFGVEVSPSDTNPAAFDCSELVEWGCARLQVTPRMPDGSWNQATHCKTHGTLVSVQTAIDTKGALLFRFSTDPFTGHRPSSAHVAVSRGDGTTIEARGRRYGVGSWSAHNRGWTHAGLVPGLDYHIPQETEAVLKRGDKGQAVADIQAALSDLGYDLGDYRPYGPGYPKGADGDYGTATETAVRQFQTKVNLAATGIVNGLTAAILGLAQP